MGKPYMSTGGIFRGPVHPWEFFPTGSPEYLAAMARRGEDVLACGVGSEELEDEIVGLQIALNVECSTSNGVMDYTSVRCSQLRDEQNSAKDNLEIITGRVDSFYNGGYAACKRALFARAAAQVEREAEQARIDAINERWDNDAARVNMFYDRTKYSISKNGQCGSLESGSGTEDGTRCPLDQCCGPAGYYGSVISRKCGGTQGVNDTSYCGTPARSGDNYTYAAYDGLGSAADAKDRQEYFDEVYHCLEGDRCTKAWGGTMSVEDAADIKCKDLKYPPESLNPPDEWNGKFGANVCPEPIENNDRSRVIVTGNTLNEWKRVKGGTDGPFDGVGWGLIKSRGGWSETDHTLGKFTDLDPAGGTSAAYSACKKTSQRVDYGRVCYMEKETRYLFFE